MNNENVIQNETAISYYVGEGIIPELGINEMIAYTEDKKYALVYTKAVMDNLIYIWEAVVEGERLEHQSYEDEIYDGILSESGITSSKPFCDQFYAQKIDTDKDIVLNFTQVDGIPLVCTANKNDLKNGKSNVTIFQYVVKASNGFLLGISAHVYDYRLKEEITENVR